MILVLSFIVCNTVRKIKPQLLKSLTSVIMVIITMVVLQDVRMKTKFQVFMVAGLTVFLYLKKVEYEGDVAG